MKSIIKSFFILFILISSHVISISKYNKFSKISTSIKNNRKHKTNLEWSDWLDTNLLLPLHFISGLSSQIEALLTLEKVVNFALNPTQSVTSQAVNFVCNKLKDEITGGTTSAPKKSNVNTVDPLDQEKKDIVNISTAFTVDKIKETAMKIFSGNECKEESCNNKAELNDICNNIKEAYKNLSSHYTEEDINNIISGINSENAKPILIVKEVGSSTYGAQQRSASSARDLIVSDSIVDVAAQTSFDHEIEVTSNLFGHLINENKPYQRNEMKEVYSKCALEIIEKQLILYNKEQDKLNDLYGRREEFVYCRVGSDSEFYYDINLFRKKITIPSSTCKSEISHKVGQADFSECTQGLLNFYNSKLIEIRELRVKNGECIEKENKPAETKKDVSILVKLYSFTLEFVKNVGKCIVLSFVKGIIKSGIKIIVNFLGNFLTGGLITAFKAVWYQIKFTYFITKALITDYSTGSEQDIKKAKESIANYYGKATGSFVNIILTIAGINKKRRHKRKLNK